MGKAKFPTGCPNCGDTNPVDGWRKPHKPTSRPWCNACRRSIERAEYNGSYRRYYAANRQKVSEKKRLKHYGISPEEYNVMVESNNGICPLCQRPPSGSGTSLWAIDHDHGCCSGTATCGKCVRGLICHNCNKTLGLVGDSVETLLAMVEYLRGNEV